MPNLTSKQMDGRYLIKQAEKAGLKVEYGRGDHVKVYGKEGRGYEIIPNRDIGRGLACKIIKWLIAAGVAFSVIMYIMN